MTFSGALLGVAFIGLIFQNRECIFNLIFMTTLDFLEEKKAMRVELVIAVLKQLNVINVAELWKGQISCPLLEKPE